MFGQKFSFQPVKTKSSKGADEDAQIAPEILVSDKEKSDVFLNKIVIYHLCQVDVIGGFSYLF